MLNIIIAQLMVEPIKRDTLGIVNLSLHIILKKPVGQVLLAVYDKNTKQYFPTGGSTGNSAFRSIGPISVKNAFPDSNSKYIFTLVIKGLVKDHTYAIGMFHDINGNGKFDQTLGIPTDGWSASYREGYSNYLKKPTWKDCKFKLTSDVISNGYTIVVHYAT